jgi:outer membrane protein assembly factor BamB
MKLKHKGFFIKEVTMNKTGKKKGLLFLALALITVFSLLIPGAALANGGDWPQFHNDEANIGYSSSTAPDTANLKWVSADIGAVPSSSVAVADGKVFAFSDATATVTCLDQADGSTLWTHPITGSSVWGSWSTPAYHNGNVFVATDGIYCLDAGDGHQVWKYTFPSGKAACNGSVTVADGKVIAGDWDGATYYCVSESDGSYLWEYDCGGGYAQGTPAYHDGKFFLTCWGYVGGNVYCVNASNGSLVWHSDGIDDGTYDWDTCGSVTVADSKCFFTTYNFGGYGELMALNETDGSVAWGPIQIERTDSTPTYHDGKIYVCGGCTGFSNEGERTYCFDASDGSLIWRTPVGAEPGALDVGNWTCSVAVADGKVFVGKPDPVNYFDYLAIYALDATDGSEVWHYDHGGASPAVAGGVVYTVDDGKVWAFEAPAYPAWDVNQDGQINVFDMILVGNHFGETGTPGWIPEDVNSDGSINVFDMIIIGNHFGE